MTLTVGSLFSGIGGFDLGLERAGMKVIWQSEIDPYASAVLRKHWPHVPNHGDIHGITNRTVGRADVICGGFPCQPFSHAGKQLGAADDRHLWPQMRRVIEELRPAWVVGENVAGIIRMELDQVLSDLDDLGYATQTFAIPAAGVDAPHRRERTWIISCDRDRDRESALSVDAEVAWMQSVANASSRRCRRPEGREVEQQRRSEVICGSEALADADVPGLEGRDSGIVRERAGEFAFRANGSLLPDDGLRRGEGSWSSECGGPQPARWLPEPGVGRVANGIPARMDRLRCLGNAIVPQIAEVIGRAIVECEA